MSKNAPGPHELALRAMREAKFNRLTKVKKEPKETNMPKPKVANADTKRAIVAGLLKRKNGCTSDDVKKATGWPSVSMPAIAKACGLKLTKEKTDKGFRYYGTAQ